MAKKYITTEEKALWQREMKQGTVKRDKYREALIASGLFTPQDTKTIPSIENTLQKFHRTPTSGTSPKLLPKEEQSKTPYDHIRASKEMIAEVGSEDELFFQQSGVQHRVMRQLKRGQLPIGREADLHGLTIAEADAKIVSLLSSAHENHIRLVRIVHGKSHKHLGKKPILKNYINQLLRERPDVLAFCSAPANQGGTGAVLVLLKPLSKVV